MVRIKLDGKLLIQGENKLYIPHGSDKTVLRAEDSPFYLSFISHMVRIKPGKVIRCGVRIILYIPHGSDKTNAPASLYVVLSSLYPTWFG